VNIAGHTTGDALPRNKSSKKISEALCRKKTDTGRDEAEERRGIIYCTQKKKGRVTSNAIISIIRNKEQPDHNHT